MRAEIIAIGSELLLGQIVDTNSAFIAKRLAEIGIAIIRQSYHAIDAFSAAPSLLCKRQVHTDGEYDCIAAELGGLEGIEEVESLHAHRQGQPLSRKQDTP